jgi:hypothetical protein
MSDHIKELAKQADDYTDNKTQMPGEYHPDWHDIRGAKFTELLINESIKVMIANDYHGEWLGEKIKEHFGVIE